MRGSNVQLARAIGVVLIALLSTGGCTGNVAPGAEPEGDGTPGSRRTEPGDGSVPRAGDLPCEVSEALASCQGCHAASPRFGAPMPLVTRDDFFQPTPSDPSVPVWTRARERIDDPSAPMPPSTAEPLSDSARAALVAWLDAGAPEGSCGSAPPDAMPEGPDLELPCEPTHVLRAHAPRSAEPYAVPAAVPNNYVCFAFRPTWSAQAQATAWAPVIGDERVVHHWILYKTATPLADGSVFDCEVMPLDSQFVMGWAPGGGKRVMPDELGFELPNPGETLFLQVHYWNVAGYEDALDDTGVAMCVTETPRPATAGILWLGTLDIRIPPRAEGYSTTGTCPRLLSATLPGPLTVLSSFPHMHELGKEIRTEIVRPNGDREMIVDERAWDFNGQHEYDADHPIQIRPGDSVRTTCVYDNPRDLPVLFGERTEDEMCFNFVTVYPTEYLTPERRCWL